MALLVFDAGNQFVAGFQTTRITGDVTARHACAFSQSQSFERPKYIRESSVTKRYSAKSDGVRRLNRRFFLSQSVLASMAFATRRAGAYAPLQTRTQRTPERRLVDDIWNGPSPAVGKYARGYSPAA